MKNNRSLQSRGEHGAPGAVVLGPGLLDLRQRHGSGRDLKAAGGTIDATNISNPIAAHFNMLHNTSVRVEEAILLLGLATVVLVAWAETSRT